MKRCAHCREPLEEMTPEEDAEARQECIQLWGYDPSEKEGFVVICDECFQKTHPDKHPEHYQETIKQLNNTDKDPIMLEDPMIIEYIKLYEPAPSQQQIAQMLTDKLKEFERLGFVKNGTVKKIDAASCTIGYDLTEHGKFLKAMQEIADSSEN